MRPFLQWPDARLRTPAAEVEVDDGARAIWDELLDVMYATPGIVGLAAPQLGHGLRLAVLDCSKERNEPVRLANPELTWVSDQMRAHKEGSPNLPGCWAEIERPSEVRVRFRNETGAVVEMGFTELWATSAQHQIDHLDGKMFFDRLSPLKRQRLLEKGRKLRLKRERKRKAR